MLSSEDRALLMDMNGARARLYAVLERRMPVVRAEGASVTLEGTAQELAEAWRVFDAIYERYQERWPG